MRGGIFGKPTALGIVPSGGIFRKPGLGGVRGGGIFSLGAFGGVVDDQIDKCVENMVADDYDPAYAKSECAKFFNTAVDCAPKCGAYRQDSPEWAACIQKCHGVPVVDYSKEKAACAAKGQIYSWLEGGCVSKEKYASCPTGTVYATYPDGSEKCIGIPTDLTKTTCPAGTKLQKVPEGEACVSPVVPTETKKTTPVKPKPTTTTTTAAEVKPPQAESKAAIPLAIAPVT